MRGLLLVVLIGCSLYGAFMVLNVFSAGTSAIHEIEGLIGALIVTVAASAGYIGSVIENPEQKVTKPVVPGPPKAP